LPNVSLSDYYCLPNKFFEYIFAGLPVLSSDLPEIRTNIKERKLGFACELKIETIKEIINHIEKEAPVISFDITDIQDLSWSAQESKLVNLYSKFFK
jgi:hypothetical protein